MASIADINVRIGAEIKQLEKGLRNSERALRRSARKFSDFGNQMTAAVTIPVAGFLGRSIQLFDKQAQSIAQVEAGLRSTNGTVGHTSEALQQMASDLQAVSTIGDEDILQNVTAQLLTFTNVTNEQFPRAQQAIIDLSTRMGTDLKGAAIQVGKALNDPVLGISALSRSGIQFTEDQKQVIKTLSETGRMAEAQTIILKELENQFGGSAKAAAEAGLGPIKQFNNSLGDMMETVGGAVLPSLTQFVQKITNLFKRFDALEASTKKTIIQTALFAAAIGPVAKAVSLVITGYKTWLGIKTALIIATKKFTFSQLSLNAAMKANPIGFMVGALAAVATGLTIAYSKSQRFRAVVAGLVSVFFEFGRIVKDTFGNLIGGFSDLVDGNFKDAGKKFQAAFMQMNPITGFAVAGARLGAAFSDGYKEKIAAEAAAMQEETVKAINIPIVPTGLPTPGTPTPTTGGGGSGGTTDLAERINKTVPALANLQSITTGMVTSTAAAGNEMERYGGLLQLAKDRAIELAAQMSPMQTTMSALGNEIGAAFDRGITSVKDFARAALDALGKVIGGIIKKGVASAIANVLGSSPLGLFLAPAAGAAASALFRGVINKIKPPALAKGGAAFGTTLATIGDNVNARSNPEVVAPASHLPGILRKAFAKDGGGMMGGGGTLTARVSGNDLLFILERAQNNRKRYGVT